MHMGHMHISIDIIITALSFFITDFLLSSVLNGVSALDGGRVPLSAGFVNPLFYIPAICKKIQQVSPTVFVCLATREAIGIMTAFDCHLLVTLHKGTPAAAGSDKKEHLPAAGVLRMFGYASLALAMSHRAVNATASLMAISDSILRLISTPASFRPCMKVE